VWKRKDSPRQTMAPAKKHEKTSFSEVCISAIGRVRKNIARPKNATTPEREAKVLFALDLLL
jgi:predicted CopG family antitoxin